MKTPEDVKAYLRKIAVKGGKSKSPAKIAAAKVNAKKKPNHENYNNTHKGRF